MERHDAGIRIWVRGELRPCTEELRSADSVADAVANGRVENHAAAVEMNHLHEHDHKNTINLVVVVVNIVV